MLRESFDRQDRMRSWGWVLLIIGLILLVTAPLPLPVPAPVMWEFGIALCILLTGAVFTVAYKGHPTTAILRHAEMKGGLTPKDIMYASTLTEGEAIKALDDMAARGLLVKQEGDGIVAVYKLPGGDA